MKRSTTLDMTEGPILRKLLLFAFPLMINSVINSLYSTADTVMMGQFAGTAAMAAVGASGAPLGLLVNFFAGLSVGVNTSCASLKGARRDRDLSDCMHTSVITGLAAGTIVAILGLVTCRPLLVSLDTPAEILDDAVLYMAIRLGAGPIWLLFSACANIMYAHGDTRTPTNTSMLCGLVNVGLNFVFVPVMGMGVEGVALATVASQVLQAAVLMVILFSPKGKYQLSVSKLRLQWCYVRSILSVGIPAGLNSIIYSISNVLLQSSVNGFGYLVIAGNTAADHVATYVNLIVGAYTAACLSATSQCYGAKKYDRINELIKKAMIGCIGMVLIATSVVTLFAKQLLMLFDGNPAVAEAGFPKLMFTIWGYLLYTVAQIFDAGLKGLRKATIALICNIVGIITPRLLWVWLIVPMMNTPIMLYLIYPISYLTSTITMTAAFLHFRKKLIVSQEHPVLT